MGHTFVMSKDSEDGGLHIAVIDDEEMVRLTVSAALRLQGWTVTSFGNEAGVSFSVVQAKPDIILMDLDMPGLTGEDLIATIHGDYGLPNTHVVFFSGKVDEKELEERARTCGADGFISKNIDTKKLNELLRSYL